MFKPLNKSIHDKYELLFLKHELFRNVEKTHICYGRMATRKVPKFGDRIFIFIKNKTSSPQLFKTLKIIRIDPVVLSGGHFEIFSIFRFSKLTIFRTLKSLEILKFGKDPESWCGKKIFEILQISQFCFQQNFARNDRIIEFLGVLKSY